MRPSEASKPALSLSIFCRRRRSLTDLSRLASQYVPRFNYISNLNLYMKLKLDKKCKSIKNIKQNGKQQLISIYLINESNSMIYFRIWLDVGESPLPAQQNAAAGENFFSVSSEILAYTIYYIIRFIFP